MQIIQTSIFFLLVLFLLLVSVKCTHNTTTTTTTSHLDNCLTQVCNYDDPTSRYVRFPFQIRNESLPKSCGYPGFNLLCDGAFRLLVSLPKAGLFSVQAIDYINQEIWLNDPDNCLPKRLLSLNLSNFDKSTFTPVQHLKQSYWLYNCTSDYFISSDSLKPIPCLSGSTYGVIASPIQITTNSTSGMCDDLGIIQVPAVGSRSGKVQPSDLSADIQLSWVEPGCSECYKHNARCGFMSYSGLEVTCFDVPTRGLPKETLVAIALAFAAPLALFTCCITYFSLRAVCYRRRRNNTSIALATAVVTPQLQPPTITGLDRSIIESYPKVILGDSRRLPKPDDKNCSICLGEYLSKETLRSLPDCGHCFHAECIDQWLERNASCPVCRNTPSSSTPDIT